MLSCISFHSTIGELVRRFSELQERINRENKEAALSSANREQFGSMPEILQEEEIKFSVAGPGQQAAAAALGAVNLGGVLYLRYATLKYFTHCL